MRRVKAFCIVFASMFLLTGCKDQNLYSGLKRDEANQMVMILRSAGITADLHDDARGQTASVIVDAESTPQALEILARAGLPRKTEGSLRDVLPKDTWMATPLEERARLSYGISQELTATLTRIPGIIDARVHVALAEKNALGETSSEPSASVLVRYDGKIMGGEFQENIKSLIANSIAGLTYDRVTVTMIPYESEANLVSAQSRSTSPGPANKSAAAFLTIFAVLAVAWAATNILLRLIRVKQ